MSSKLSQYASTFESAVPDACARQDILQRLQRVIQRVTQVVSNPHLLRTREYAVQEGDTAIGVVLGTYGKPLNAYQRLMRAFLNIPAQFNFFSSAEALQGALGHTRNLLQVLITEPEDWLDVDNEVVVLPLLSLLTVLNPHVTWTDLSPGDCVVLPQGGWIRNHSPWRCCQALVHTPPPRYCHHNSTLYQCLHVHENLCEIRNEFTLERRLVDLREWQSISSRSPFRPHFCPFVTLDVTHGVVFPTVREGWNFLRHDGGRYFAGICLLHGTNQVIVCRHGRYAPLPLSCPYRPLGTLCLTPQREWRIPLGTDSICLDVHPIPVIY